MVVTENIGNIIQDLDVIIRANVGEKKDPSTLFRNPDTSEEAIRSSRLTARGLRTGNALIDILEYLENRYGIDFDSLEQKRSTWKGENHG